MRKKFKKLWSKTYFKIYRLSKRDNFLGSSIRLAYHAISNPIIQAVITAFAGIYLGTMIDASNPLFTKILSGYLIYIVLCGLTNKYRESRMKTFSVMDSVIKDHTAAFMGFAEELYDVMYVDNKLDFDAIYDEVNDKVVQSIHQLVSKLYQKEDYKITLFAVYDGFTEDNVKACKMEMYNKTGITPESYRKIYKSTDENLPFFAKLLFDDKDVNKLLDKRGIVVIKDKEEIKKLFTDSDQNTTAQYIGAMVKIDTVPCMLLQICTSEDNGFIGDVFIEEVVDKIVLPYIAVLKFFYELETLFESRKGALQCKKNKTTKK